MGPITDEMRRTRFVLYDGIPRKVKMVQVEQPSTRPIYTLEPVYGLCPLECVYVSDCVAITEDEALIIDDLDRLGEEELVARHRELRQKRRDSPEEHPGGRRRHSRLRDPDSEGLDPNKWPRGKSQSKRGPKKTRTQWGNAMEFFGMGEV